ncbi:MAG: DUF6364 family protein [Mycobacteriales bacterium]
MSSRNITLSLPADLVRRAKVIAATRDTSVSALVADYLSSLTEDEDDYERLWRDERQLMAQGLSMRVGKLTWSRDDVHER